MSNDKIVFKGRLVSLVTKRIRLPNGYTGDFEIIEHPGAALVIPFLSKNKVILLRQFRGVINDYIYELPAGTRKEKELPLNCAKREIIEETGFSAGKFTELGCIYPVPGYSTEKIVVYKASGLKKQEAGFDKDEIIETTVVTKAQVKRLFKHRKLVDAKTISAFAFVGWL